LLAAKIFLLVIENSALADRVTGNGDQPATLKRALCEKFAAFPACVVASGALLLPS